MDDSSIAIVDLQKFQKSEDELETMLDKWLYLLKYLPFMKERPAIYHEPIFKEFFKKAEFMKLTTEDREKYTDANKKACDHYSQISTAEKNGMEIGMEKGMKKGMKKGRANTQIEIVRNLLHETDFSIQKIAKIAKVSNTMVKKLSMEEVCV